MAALFRVLAIVAGWFGISSTKLIILLAGSLGLVMSVGGLYLKVKSDIRKAVLIEQLQKERDNLRRAIEVDTEEAKRNATANANFRRKVRVLEDYISKIPDADRECLNSRDTHELQKLWDR